MLRRQQVHKLFNNKKIEPKSVPNWENIQNHKVDWW